MFNWLKKILPVSEDAGRTGFPGGSMQQLPREPKLSDESLAYKRQGNELLAQGQLAEAAECYRRAVSISPDYAEGHLNLGFVLNAQERHDEAEPYLERAIALDPGLADAHYLLGTIVRARGNLDKAIAYFNRALELKPDFEMVYRDLSLCLFQVGHDEAARQAIEKAISYYPDSVDFHYLRGKALVSAGKPDEAIAAYRKVLRSWPGNAEVHFLLGNIFQKRGDWNEAMVHYREALALQPDYVEACNNLGTVLQELGNLEEAMACYRKVLMFQPSYAQALNNLGAAWQKLGNLEEAMACYRKALALTPASAEVNSNLAIVLHGMGRLDEAVVCYRKTLALKPDFAEAYNDLANVLREQGHWEEAIACYRKALTLAPNLAQAHNNLGLMFNEQHRLDEALASYRRALQCSPHFHRAQINLLHILQYRCEWESLAVGAEEVRRAVREGPPTEENKIPPFSFLALPGTTPAEQKICAIKWVQSEYAAQCSRRMEMGFVFRRKARPRLRIGYLSTDFRNHPVAHLMAEVFELHDRARFEITAYSYGPDDGSAVRKRLETGFDHFVDVRNLSDQDAATRIYRDGIDILVDLTGHTHGTRSGMLALRPAPIQVSYIGYLGTMGADFIDYIIADPFLIPPEDQQHYTEKVAYLPSYQANDRQCAIAETPSRMACGLPDQGFVFCCFNQSYKILPEVFDVWMRLLTAVPGSVLWLYAPEQEAERNLRREAAARSVAPERLIFAETLPLEQHLARLKCADLFLDTLPYNAGTTASNALWAGLPVVTCAGKTFSSRMAGSLLTALGVPELITYNLTDYYMLALALASDRSRCEAIRAKIGASRDSAPLFDSSLFTRNLEAAYWKMWEGWVDSPAA